MSWIIKGILVGFAFAFFIGPIFFIYLQSCVKRGFKFGFFVAFGAWLSDLLLIVVINLVVLILTPAIKLEEYAYLFYGVGGLVLLIVGMQMYFVKTQLQNEYEDELLKSNSPHLRLLLIGKGFIVNLLNPAVLFYWFGLSVNMTINDKCSSQEVFLFLGGALFIRIIMDALKIYLGKSIGKYLTLQKMAVFQRITGIVIVLIGIGLLTTGWTYAREIFIQG